MNKIDKRDILFIVIGITIIGYTYFSIKKKNKSFLEMTEEEKKDAVLDNVLPKKEKSILEMTEAEKKAYTEEDTAIRLAIQNSSELTQQQKNEAEQFINKNNLDTMSQEEMTALAEYNLNNIMTGATQIKDAGLPSFLGGFNF